jgi:ABC-type transport system substrate-binding protein
VYSTLVKYGMHVREYPGNDTITGDAMESWETSPDGLTVTYKLRPNHKFDPRPPTNGRAMTTQDVKWSWDRVAAVSPVTADILREKSPTGFIESLSTPDNNTVTIKLAEPYGALQETMAYWYFYIAPIEADGRFDLKQEARGSGPFRLERLEPSVGLNYKKNTDWYQQGRPFLDGFDALLITEVAQQVAQFDAGTLWTSGNTWLPEDVLRLKRNKPDVRMHAASVFGAPGAYPLLFGTRFAKDARLRRAVSMMYDREALIEAAYGTKAWTDAGLDVETYWDGHLSNRSAEWIDPSGNGLGEGAKYFQVNLEEAKKLLSAAGYNNENLTFDFRANFGPPNVVEILHGMMLNGGLNVELRPRPENEWRNLKASFGEGFQDFLWSTSNSYNADGYLATKYTPGGKDKVTPNAIPGITDSILRMRREMDNTKRAEMVQQIQKDLALEMPDLPAVSTLPVAGYNLTQPWLRNNVWVVPGFSVQSSTARPYTAYWYDASKRS